MIDMPRSGFAPIDSSTSGLWSPAFVIPADIYDSPSAQVIRRNTTAKARERLYDLGTILSEKNLIGQPGYGSIAVLQEAAARVDGGHRRPLLQGQCLPERAPGPYWDVVDNDSPFK